MAQISKKICNLCESNPGWHFCYECQQLLCKECRSTHDKLLPNHAMERFENVDWLGFRNCFQCNIHNGEYVHFCLTCTSHICLKCVTTNHKGHEFADINEKIAKDRNNAKQCLETLKGRAKELRELKEKTLSKTFEILMESTQNAEQLKDDVFKEMMLIISGSRHIAEVGIRDFERLQRQNLDSFIQNLNVIIENNSRLCSQMEHLLNEKNDKLFYMGYARINLELEYQETIPKEPTDIETPLFDYKKAYLEIIQQLKSRIEEDRLCEHCNRKEIAVKDLSESNAELNKIMIRQECKQRELEHALSKERIERRNLQRDLENIKEACSSYLKEISRLKMKLENPEETEEKTDRSMFFLDRIFSSFNYSISSLFGQNRSEEGKQAMDPLWGEDCSEGFIEVQKYKCIKHKAQFTYFCKCHAMPVCDLCKTDHDTCHIINEIEESINGMKDSDVEEQYDNICLEVSSLSNILHQVIQISSLATTNECLNVLDSSERTEMHSTEKINVTLKEVYSRVKKMKRGEISIVSHISENRKLDKFLLSHAYKDEMKICIEKMQTAIAEYSKKSKIIEPRFNLNIEMLKSSVLDFSLQFLYRSVSLSLSTISNDCQGLHSIHLIQKLNLKINSARSKTNIPGCTVFKNGQIALTDPDNDRLIFIGSDGVQTYQHIQNKPYGIVEFLNNDFAITLYRQRTISIIDKMSQMKVIKFSECGGLSGIAMADDSLIVRVNGFGFFKISAEGSIVDKIRIENEDCHMQNVCCINRKLYFAKWNENKVYCSDLKGNIIWTFQNENVLQAPVGITVDEQELVYVTGLNSKNVVVISSCGNNFRELICGMKPSAIHYALATKQLLVCGFYGEALLYDVYKSK